MLKEIPLKKRRSPFAKHSGCGLAPRKVDIFEPYKAITGMMVHLPTEITSQLSSYTSNQPNKYTEWRGRKYEPDTEII